MEKDFIKVLGWLTVSPSRKPWFEIDPYYSPYGHDEATVVAPTNYKTKPPVTGWCSWYAFGANITEQKIVNNLQWFAKNREKVPIEYIQIDDGYTRYGDWQIYDSQKFPNGLKPLVKQIKESGFKAGIWLAPFLLDLNSEVAQHHPDWVLRDSNNRPVFGHMASVLYPGFMVTRRYILNTHHPEAYKYILQSIDFLVKEVGFDLLKLDFESSLYFDPYVAGPKRYDNLIRLFLSYIKSTYPKVYTLTGVCPIAPTAGETDALRISDDNIIPQLDGVWLINSIVHSQRLRQLERNLKARRKLAKLWSLDPDAFVCRSSLGLSEGQIEKLASLVKGAKGIVFLGDDMPALPKERVEKYIWPLFEKN